MAYEVGDRVLVTFRFSSFPGTITDNSDSSTYSVTMNRPVDGQTDFSVIRYRVTTEAEIYERQGGKAVAPVLVRRTRTEPPVRP
jgi:hypothetical protein